jgi:hypothetical protein
MFFFVAPARSGGLRRGYLCQNERALRVVDAPPALGYQAVEFEGAF